MNHQSFKIPAEVELLQNDTDALGMVNDSDNWYVTEEWVQKFRNHLKVILPLAENGDPVAQYNVATIYLCGYLYSSEEKAIKAYEADAIVMSKWFERAARSGYVVAIDNLISTGVGDEAERLKRLFI
ncbi:MAG: hypothetical protein L3J46_08545, partial [Kangiellaceae bacterium]|nr:hypothetical protein [Kangiellaceae bacterium]